MKTGIEQINEERQRQIDIERYDVDSDAESYQGGQLMGAAGCYLANALNKLTNQTKFSKFEVMSPIGTFTDAWPWAEMYDKREKHDGIRSLVIAGALIAAEIDRINKLTP